MEVESEKKKLKKPEKSQKKQEEKMKEYVALMKFMKLQIANLNKEKQKLEKKVVKLKAGESIEEDEKQQRN